MEKLSPVEVRVKILVDAFLADKISRAKFRRELLKEKAQLRPRKQRTLPKTGGRIFS
jgi:hypothetical protein